MLSVMDLIFILIELVYLKYEIDINLIEALISIFIYIVFKYLITLLACGIGL
nr:MAG TPA: hypothetical protein [Caudoviricetes sp.]